MFRKAISTICGLSLAVPYAMESNNPPPSDRHAICILYPNNSNVRGIVSFSQ